MNIFVTDADIANWTVYFNTSEANVSKFKQKLLVLLYTRWALHIDASCTFTTYLGKIQYSSDWKDYSCSPFDVLMKKYDLFIRSFTLFLDLVSMSYSLGPIVMVIGFNGRMWSVCQRNRAHKKQNKNLVS